jgi:hypothetical protein
MGVKRASRQPLPHQLLIGHLASDVLPGPWVQAPFTAVIFKTYTGYFQPTDKVVGGKL